MNDVPVSNTGKMMMYVGGHMIPPGETRLLPAHHVPEHLWPVPSPVVAPEAPDPLTDLLTGNVKSVVEALPGLDVEQLMELEALEALREAPRKGVLEAVAEALLERAADEASAKLAAGGGDGG